MSIVERGMNLIGGTRLEMVKMLGAMMAMMITMDGGGVADVEFNCWRNDRSCDVIIIGNKQ